MMQVKQMTVGEFFDTFLKDDETGEREHDGIFPRGAMERLALFGEWTGTKPPTDILQDGSFSEELIVYADENGMSLDWMWLADEKSLVMQAHEAAKGGRG